MRALLLALFLMGCPGTEDDPKDTGAGDTDDSGGGDTDTFADLDRDEDGFPASVDCDDTRAAVNPDAPADICNGLDDDCDQSVDEDPDLTWYPDEDQDGFGEAGAGGSQACTFDAGGGEVWATNDADCDDENPESYPGAEEFCDGADNDCNGAVDENPATWLDFYADADGDGAGDPNVYVQGCDAAAAGGAENAWDCDDLDAEEPVFADANWSTRGSGTLASPYRSLQSALDHGATCVVAFDGTYFEDLTLPAADRKVWAPDGPDVTIVEGTGRASVVTATSGAEAKLDGFTLTGGGGTLQSSYYTDGYGYSYYYNYYYGGAVYLAGSTLTLSNVVLRENELPPQIGEWTSSYVYQSDASYGGAIYASGGTLTLDGVDLVDNFASWGGALHVDYGTVVASDVRIAGNKAEYFTVSQYGGAVGLEGALVSSNTSDYGYDGFYLGAYGVLGLRNVTLVGHQYATYLSEGTVELVSSIVAYNGYGIYDAGSGTTVTTSYSDVYGNGSNWYGESDPTGSRGNISAEPMFYAFSDDDDWTNDDLTLTAGSLAIDAGDPTNATDRDGSRTDMGAYGGPNGVER